MQIQTKLPSRGKINPHHSKAQKSVSTKQTINSPTSSTSTTLDRLNALKTKPTKTDLQNTQDPAPIQQPQYLSIPELPVYNPKNPEDSSNFDLPQEVEPEIESDFSEFDHLPNSQFNDQQDKDDSQPFYKKAFNNFNKPKKREKKPWINNKTAASNPSDLEAMFFGGD
jgi:hypothetical protein